MPVTSLADYRKSLREEAIKDGSYNENLTKGAEFLYPGRRNFFSPITSYKAVKSRFYKDGDTTYNAENVPIMRWEVDILAHHANMDSDFMWDSVGVRDYDDTEYDAFDLHDTEDYNYNAEVVDYTSSLDCWWNTEEDSDELTDVQIAALCNNASFIAVNTEDNIYSPDLLDEVVRIENKTGLKTLDCKPEFDAVTYNKIKLIINKLEGSEVYDDPKKILKRNIAFIKKSRKNIDSDEKIIEYDTRRPTEYLLNNIHHQLGLFINQVDTYIESGVEWNEENWFHLEKSFFFFLRLDFRIQGSQRVALIPSGGGKTTLHRRYHKYVMDIDYLLHLYGDYSYFYFLIEYSRIFNRWHVINGFWRFILFKYHQLYQDKILLAHSIQQIPHFDKVIVIGLVPNKKDDYNKRQWQSNLQSIRQEVNTINCPQKSLFYYLYRIFIIKDELASRVQCFTFTSE